MKILSFSPLLLLAVHAQWLSPLLLLSHRSSDVCVGTHTHVREKEALLRMRRRRPVLIVCVREREKRREREKNFHLF